MIGQTISHYRVLKKLGEGGMGVVYKAEDLRLKRTVALKFLSPQAIGAEDDKARFIHEAQAAAALNHPNICTIFEIDEHEGQPFIAMELVEGVNLKTKLGSGPTPISEAARITGEIATGLQDAHARKIIHRDIKPHNIMITPAGRAKIMDFGLAKSPNVSQLTKDGSTVGTVAYMSPEQTRGDTADHRSDIWSLGVVLYEIVAGSLPFRGGHEQAIIYSILNQDPKPLPDDVPEGLSTIVSRCLAKDPAERYASAGDLAVDLDRFGRGETPSVPVCSGHKRVNSQPPAGLQTPMNKWLWLLIMCVPAIAALIVLVIVPRFFSLEVKTPGTTDSDRKTLAVLPFENLGPPAEEYFADGITEELIARLAKLGRLGVIARTTIMQYKGTDKTIEDIGEELGVDYILEGTIRWRHLGGSKSQVRITPQLVRVSDETHLWAEVYQRDMTDIFAIQEEIAGQVAQAMDMTLLDTGKKGPPASNPTDNTDAYRAYLEARFWWNKRSPEGFDRAIGLFDDAIRIDPNYARAYAGKAECYCMLAIHLARPAEYVETARTAAQRALD
ncbi:MAG: protein kinase, partial [Candidatus Latescibacterota bacterium]